MRKIILFAALVFLSIFTIVNPVSAITTDSLPIENFSETVDTTFNYATGDLKYSYKNNFSVVARIFFVVDVSQTICSNQGWNWNSPTNSCYIWWTQAKQYMIDSGINYNIIINKFPTYHKYGLNFSNIPPAVASKLIYIGLHLEEVNGLTWNDVSIVNNSIIIKNKIRLSYNDLIQSGFTLTLYDKQTVLIGNVSNKTNMWLDPTTDTVGSESAGASIFNQVLASPITASASGSLQTLGGNINTVGTGCDIRLGIYSDSGGTKPLSLLAESSTAAASVGWNDLSVTGVTINAGTKYWVAAQQSNNNGCTYWYVAGAPGRSYYAKAWGAFDASWAASTEDAYSFNYRMTYNGGAAPTQNNITYSNNITTFPVNYNGTRTIFNVTIGTNTTNGLSWNTSLIEINYTGNLVNYTMNRFPLNVSNYNLTLGAGTYRYREIFNNSANNYNTTGYVIFSIGAGIATPLLTVIPTSPAWYSNTTTATCGGDNSEQRFLLYRNTINVTTAENNTGLVLPAATWAYECNATATGNYSSVAASQNYVVQKLPIVVHIAINGTEANTAYIFGNTTNVTAWNSSQLLYSAIDLYRNGTIVGNPDIQTLAIGIFTYTVNTNSSNHSVSETRVLTINAIPAAATAITTITLVGSCDPFWVNFEIIAAFILAWLGIAGFFLFTNKLPDVIRPFLWFFLILSMIMLLFSTPYPTNCFTQAQIDFINILVTITIMLSVALGVYSVRG